MERKAPIIIGQGYTGQDGTFFSTDLPRDGFSKQKWLIQKIDRLRRSFLWRGDTPNKVYGGHSLVNWPTTCLRKKGGLGILELERFARALRLR